MMPPILAKLTRLVSTKRGRIDRRAFRRLTPGHLTPCQVRPPGEPPRPAWVHNLSLHGAGILADREYEPGTRLGLLLVNAAHTFALSVEMDVVRCFRVVSGDYFVGGEFDRQLRHDELMPFMI
jgi:hypothetical protein